MVCLAVALLELWGCFHFPSLTGQAYCLYSAVYVNMANFKKLKMKLNPLYNHYKSNITPLIFSIALWNDSSLIKKFNPIVFSVLIELYVFHK